MKRLEQVKVYMSSTHRFPDADNCDVQVDNITAGFTFDHDIFRYEKPNGDDFQRIFVTFKYGDDCDSDAGPISVHNTQLDALTVDLILLCQFSQNITRD